MGSDADLRYRIAEILQQLLDLTDELDLLEAQLPARLSEENCSPPHHSLTLVHGARAALTVPAFALARTPHRRTPRHP